MELQQLSGMSSAITALFSTQLAKEQHKVLQISQLLIAGDALGHRETPLKGHWKITIGNSNNAKME